MNMITFIISIMITYTFKIDQSDILNDKNEYVLQPAQIPIESINGNGFEESPNQVFSFKNLRHIIANRLKIARYFLVPTFLEHLVASENQTSHLI